MNKNYQIDYSKAIASKEFRFKPFRPRTGQSLNAIDLSPDEDLLVMDREGKRYAFLMRQLGYHHLAQGELNGNPYLVSF